MGCPLSKAKRRSTEHSKMKIGHEEGKENSKVNILSSLLRWWNYTHYIS